jgi:hypothetical protein
MSPNMQIICSFALTFGVPMAVAVREYWTLGTPPGGLPKQPPVMPEPQPLPDAGVKRLPECLIPKIVRVREPA